MREALERAADPSTPAHELQRLGEPMRQWPRHRFRLATDEQRELIYALARNPCTPFDLLLELARLDPSVARMVPQNPSFELYLLTAPTLPFALPMRALYALASSPDVPAPLLAQVVERDLKLGFAAHWMDSLLGHPSLPADTVARCCGHANAAVRRLAARHPNASPEQLRLYARLGSAADLQTAGPPDPSITAAELERASRLGDWGALLVASHPAASPSILERLADLKNPQVQQAVAANPATPAQALVNLHRQATGSLAPLAGNPSSPPELLLQLAWNPELAVPLAHNPSTPPGALRLLTGAHAAEARAAALAHPSLPADWGELLRRLGFPTDLAEGPAAPPAEGLEALLAGGPWFQDLLVSWMPLPEPVQLALAASPYHAVRRALAASRGLLPTVALRMVSVDRPADKLSVIEGPNATPEIIVHVLQHETHAAVLKAILAHPLTPRAALETLVGRLSPELLIAASPTASMLERLREAGHLSEVVFHVRSRKADPFLLGELASHEEWMIRRAVASNPRASRAVLRLLSGDPEPRVSEEAAQALMLRPKLPPGTMSELN